MRANEFLIEYNRAITTQKFGPALLQAIVNDTTMILQLGIRKPITGSDAIEQEIQNNAETYLPRVIQAFENVDPTRNNQYTPWIIKTYINEWKYIHGTLFEDLRSTLTDYLTKFYNLVLRKKISSPRNDILGYRSFEDFFDVLDEYPDPTDPNMAKGNALELYQDNTVRAIIPENKQAACYYGQGTRWCTAATTGTNYFDSYHSSFPLVILLPKQPQYTGEKYQLYFSVFIDDIPITSGDQLDEYYHTHGEDFVIDNTDDQGQFMNEKDQPVALDKLVKRFGQSFENIVQALVKYNPHVGYAVNVNFNNIR
jgi:hypothetical protein